MTPRESFAAVQELATLADDHTEGLDRIRARLDDLDRAELEEALLSAVGALRSHYRTDAEWQAAALRVAEYMADTDDA
ncbi:hypothetical protein [Streptomonospora wellingtoniae]|uniref:Uncharacterized protein n=1 Tax=Streptomonospora wellingtoniae TaxID=3075544 RepID=A0ABU2KUJ3_9ACTN|nr:hypothetical protein [Streptomonospora sp. DSM 45055]MDT0302928.1 hypothetical protein [Streptomonospora sp. DSM 45055]